MCGAHHVQNTPTANKHLLGTEEQAYQADADPRCGELSFKHCRQQKAKAYEDPASNSHQKTKTKGLQ